MFQGKNGNEISKTRLNVIIDGKIDNKDIKWSSSNPKIVSVNINGIIEGLNNGTAIITAQKGSNKATCNVTVKVIEPITSIKFDNVRYLTKYVGEEGDLVVKITPTNATNKNIEWESTNKSVVKLFPTGVYSNIVCYECVGVGKTRIIAKATDGSRCI